MIGNVLDVQHLAYTHWLNVAFHACAPTVGGLHSSRSTDSVDWFESALINSSSVWLHKTNRQLYSSSGDSLCVYFRGCSGSDDVACV